MKMEDRDMCGCGEEGGGGSVEYERWKCEGSKYKSTVIRFKVRLSTLYRRGSPRIIRGESKPRPRRTWRAKRLLHSRFWISCWKKPWSH